MRCPPRISLCGLLILSMSRPLGAQRPLSMDVGVAVANFPTDNVSAGGPYVRLSATAVRPNFFGSFDAGAIASFGASSGYGVLRLGTRTAPAPGIGAVADAELSSVAGSNHNGAAGTALLSGKVQWQQAHWGSWIGGSGHSSSRSNSTLTGLGAEAGGWYALPQVQVSVSALHEWTRAELYTGRFRTGFAGTVPVAYTEGTAAVHAEGGRTALDVSGVLRRDPDASKLWDAGVSASLSLWTSARLAFVVTAARQLPDWIHGADEARTLTIGLRWWQPSPERARALSIPPVIDVSDDGDERTVRVRAAFANAVDVMGDFTSWEPLVLERSGDYFQARTKLTRGSHRVVVRIDGGAWRAAANTPTVNDEFGGKVGLLVVP